MTSSTRFPIVSRMDGQSDGEYRMKQLILNICNGMDTPSRLGSPTRSSSPRLLATDLSIQTRQHDR
jgi:hypothetical protein